MKLGMEKVVCMMMILMVLGIRCLVTILRVGVPSAFAAMTYSALFEFQHLSSNQTGQAGPARNTESQKKGTHTFSKEDHMMINS